MKTKNLVSLSVALAFLVLAVTGVLIYFGQGSHPVEHTHAWFGMLFVLAAVFHIVNNWSSITAYSRDRRTGGIKKEFVIPAVLAVVFAAGIATDLPGFNKLANAGKSLFRGERPKRGGPLTQSAADSIGRLTEATFGKALNTGDTAVMAGVMAPTATLWSETGALAKAPQIGKAPLEGVQWISNVVRVDPVGDQVMVIYGTLNHPSVADQFYRFTHVLKQDEGKWRIVGGQMAPAGNAPKTAVR